MKFSELGLSAPLCVAARRAGYVEPTAIQAQAVTPALHGRDVIGIARTGTGKTAAFLLPLAEQLLSTRTARRGRRVRQVRALVLCPTRELALQVAADAVTLTRGCDLRVLCVHGKVSLGPQADAIAAGVDLLVATPGRVQELLDAEALDLSLVRHVVLDEADRMLDMGFEPQVRAILAHVPGDRQMLLFTATFGGSVEALASGLLRSPVRIETDPSATAAPHVEQAVAMVTDRDKTPLLLALLAGADRGGAPRSGVVVFARTRRRAGWISAALTRHAVTVEVIHGDRSHAQRVRALERFAAGRAPVLIATDVAARGLHIEAVRTVVNYDVPTEPEEYVHRIGRARHGVRASANGESIAFVDDDEREAWLAIEQTLGIRARRVELPDLTPFRAPWEREVARTGRGGKAVGADATSTGDRRKVRTKKSDPTGESQPARGARKAERPKRSRKSRPIGKQKPGAGVRRPSA